jgi:hypothetical protein
MGNIVKKHKFFWSQKHFLLNVFLGLLLLTASLFTTYYANFYTTIHASNSVTDIILDNIPIVNVDVVYSEGATVFLIILLIIALYEPRRIPFELKSIALFYLVRSAFVILTHLGPPPFESYLDPTDLIHKLSSGDDLFFSMHTGLPFLMALIFWDEKKFRYLFLFFTIVGAATVLLGHLHYSIDVFSAFFISFGIFHASKKIFPKDYQLLVQGNS